jgi:uncharacterized phiE125 gp8 family phage protein
LTDWNETNRLTVVASPVSEPVTVASVKTYAQIDSGFTADDTLLSTFAKQARDWCQLYTGRRFGQYQYDLYLDAFPADGIELPFPPLVSVDEIYYVASDGASTLLPASDYRVDSVDENRTARIVRAYGVTWPLPQAITNAVRVRFTCGYSTVPDLLLNSAYDYAKSLYDHAAPDLDKLQLWLAPYVVHRWG